MNPKSNLLVETKSPTSARRTGQAQERTLMLSALGLPEVRSRQLESETTSKNQDVPPFEKEIVDPVGAGDAFCTIASLAATIGLPIDASTYLAQMAGAQAVRIIGNSEAIKKANLLKGNANHDQFLAPPLNSRTPLITSKHQKKNLVHWLPLQPEYEEESYNFPIRPKLRIWVVPFLCPSFSYTCTWNFPENQS